MTVTGVAHFSLLEVSWPGTATQPAGVILVDPESGRARFRLRRDWQYLVGEDDVDLWQALQDDLNAKLIEFGPEGLLSYLEGSLSGVLRIGEREPVEVRDFDWALNSLYRQHVPAKVLPFRTHLPLYSLRAAAGGFGEDEEVRQEDWVEAPEDLRMAEDQFVAHVVGDSMEPLIPADSLCVFRKPRAGSRNGKIVLVQLEGSSVEGGEVTVKRYRSEKHVTEDGYQHEQIIMEPLNQPKHQPWKLSPEEQDRLRVIGEFIRVL
jgi:SOS-response transcriptional repressor LexA